MLCAGVDVDQLTLMPEVPTDDVLKVPSRVIVERSHSRTVALKFPTLAVHATSLNSTEPDPPPPVHDVTVALAVM
jgi:hypothetical protein